MNQRERKLLAYRIVAELVDQYLRDAEENIGGGSEVEDAQMRKALSEIEWEMRRRSRK